MSLLKLQAAHELKTGVVPWIARVSSKSNIADDPSRELMEELPGFDSATRSTVSVRTSQVLRNAPHDELLFCLQRGGKAP